MFYTINFLVLTSILLASKTECRGFYYDDYIVIEEEITEEEEDHWGNFFVFSFLEHSDTAEFVVVITTREISRVTIKFLETGFKKQVTLSSRTSFKHIFSKSVAALPAMEVLPRKAVSVESDVKVSVYGYAITLKSADGFLVLPVVSLGIEYLTVTMENSNVSTSGRPQIVITAVNNDTKVAIDLQSVDVNKCLIDSQWSSKIYTNGYVITFNMDAYDVFNVNCFRDTTGSMVTSNKPVAVITGCKCLSLPAVATCDHFVEMLPPTSEFGSRFIIKAPVEDYDVMLRILALKNDTKFTGIAVKRVLHSRQFVTLTLSPLDLFCFSSNHPVLVTLFMTGTNDVAERKSSYYGDAFMMLVPPTDKYTNDYVVDAGVVSDNHLTSTLIISPLTVFFDFQYSLEAESVADCPKYMYDRQSFPNVRRFSASQPFMILFYGLGVRVAYGYPAGMKISKYGGPGSTTPDFGGGKGTNPKNESVNTGNASAQDLATEKADVTSIIPSKYTTSAFDISTYSSAIPIESSSIFTDSSTMFTDSSTMFTDSSTVFTYSSRAFADIPSIFIGSSSIFPDSSTIFTYSSSIFTDSSTIFTDSSTIFTDSSTVFTDSSTMSTDSSSIDSFTLSTLSTIFIYSSTIYPGESNDYIGGKTLSIDRLTNEGTTKAIDTTETKAFNDMNLTSGYKPDTEDNRTPPIVMTTHNTVHVTYSRETTSSQTSQSNIASYIRLTSDVISTTTSSKIDFLTSAPTEKMKEPRSCKAYLRQCPCPCNTSHLNETDSSTLKKKNLVELLLTNSKLSKTRRSKTSVQNTQQSEFNLGVSAILFLTSAVSTIILLDILRCSRSIHRRSTRYY